jgi:fructokinase
MTESSLWVLGEALIDCVAQSDGSLQTMLGGSPFNLACAAALQGADVGYLNPLSTDMFGKALATRLSEWGAVFASAFAQANFLGGGSAGEWSSQLWVLP